MRNHFSLLPLFAFAATLALTGCGKDTNTKICLEKFEEFDKAVEKKDDKARELAGTVYQSCGISCDLTKDEDACKAHKRVTEVICEKEGKKACEDLCSGGNEKNEHACAALAAMK